MEIHGIKFDANFKFPNANDHRAKINDLRDLRIQAQIRGQIWVRLKDALSLFISRAELTDCIWAGYRDAVWIGLAGHPAEAEHRKETESTITKFLNDCFQELRNQSWKVTEQEGNIEISCQ